MPYISVEDVKEIRKRLKQALPQYKLSVRNLHYHEVLVTVQEGPIDFIFGSAGYHQVNTYYIEKHYADQPEAVRVLSLIRNTITQVKPVDGHQDSDYGFVPNYYMSIHVGAWDKPYKRRRV